MSATQGIAVSPSGSRSIHEPQPRPLAEARTVRYFGDENESVTFVHARLTRLRQTRGRLSSLTAPPVVLAMPPAVSRSGRVGFPSLSRPGAGLCEGDAVLGECLNGIRKLTTVRAVKFLSNVSRILHGGWRALSARAPVVVTGRLSAPFFLQKCLKDGHALVFWSRPPPFRGVRETVRTSQDRAEALAVGISSLLRGAISVVPDGDRNRGLYAPYFWFQKHRGHESDFGPAMGSQSWHSDSPFRE